MEQVEEMNFRMHSFKFRKSDEERVGDRKVGLGAEWLNRVHFCKVSDSELFKTSQANNTSCCMRLFVKRDTMTVGVISTR